MKVWGTFVAVVEKIPVLAVAAIVVWSYVVFVSKILVTFDLAPAVLLGIVLHILLLLFVASYFQVVRTHPGTPTMVSELEDHAAASDSPSETDEDHFSSERYKSIETKKDGSRRFCQKCQQYKPDRSHHCSVCNQCILKMDHHCPWVSNCVGFKNYKYFFQFVFYGFIYALFVFSAAVSALIPVMMSSRAFLQLDFQSLFVLIIAAVFGACLFIFFCMHTSLILSNRTTIESMEGAGWIRLDDGSIANDVRVKSLKDVNIYDLNYKENFAQVMGTKYIEWFLPIPNKRAGSGHSFPLNDAVIQHLSC